MTDVTEEWINSRGNVFLVFIVLGTIMLIFHGKTLIQVPRSGVFHIKPINDTEDGWYADLDELEEIDQITLPGYTSENDPNWEPPCLPDEAPKKYTEKDKHK